MVKQSFKTNIVYIITYISVFLYCQNILPSPTILLFFKPGKNIQYYLKRLKHPGKLAKYNIESILESKYISGIIGTYAGYINYSDINGQLIFPRKQDTSDLFLVITTQVSPIIRFEQTVDHWELIPGVSAALYSVTEVYNEKEKGYYWNVQLIERPQENIIPYSAIVLFAKPKNILVKTGLFEKKKSTNLILPPIFIEKGINIVKNATYVLNMRHLFSNVKASTQIQPKLHQILLHE